MRWLCHPSQASVNKSRSRVILERQASLGGRTNATEVGDIKYSECSWKKLSWRQLLISLPASVIASECYIDQLIINYNKKIK